MKVIKEIIKFCSECPYYIDKIYFSGFKENSVCKAYMVCGKTSELKPNENGCIMPKWCPLEDYKEVKE